jgi:DNA adenine methylase
MFDSPLRYPGGKGRLAQFIIDLIEMNGLTGGHYVEPYAGGAGIAISLLYLEYVSHVHLNDLDRSVHAFWRSVIDQPEALCKLILDTPITVDEWHRQKAVQAMADADTLLLGFSTFYLNRTNRSGIISARVIGGMAQAGAWKLDARFNKAALIQRVAKIASYAPRISLCNMDAAAFLKGPVRRLPLSTLVYLDPPYFAKGQKLYENNYNHADHAALAALVAKIKQRWIVSYDDAAPIRQFYSAFRQQSFGLNYSAQARYKGSEIMVFCDRLKMPGAVEPWRGIAV